MVASTVAALLLGSVLFAAVGNAQPDISVARLDTWVSDIKTITGNVRQLAQTKRLDLAVEKLDELIRLAEELRKDVQEVDRPSPVPATPKESISYDTGAKFEFNTTFKPPRCDTNLAKLGHTMRVQFVGKLLATGKVFVSSFHTGSVPYKFVLGSDDVVEGWNRALVGMCPEERRAIVVPWRLGYGEEGEPKLHVPPYADLQYFVEMVSISTRPVPGYSRRKSKAAQDDSDQEQAEVEAVPRRRGT